MAKKPPATDATPAKTEAETAADKVRAERKARREAKAADEAAKAAVKKPGMGRPGDGRKNVFGIQASASKAASVSRSIISRSRGGRGR
jgi:regulator of protease activity HflC (stomatin/prohibitin superfamily)